MQQHLMREAIALALGQPESERTGENPQEEAQVRRFRPRKLMPPQHLADSLRSMDDSISWTRTMGKCRLVHKGLTVS